MSGTVPPGATGAARSRGAVGRIPATVITGFLGAGKTTLLRHVLAHAGGRRIAVIVNEFGSLGIDGDTLRACGIPGCRDEDVIELANGCICCTVADDFLPTMHALLARAEPPEHIVIETSGLALPKPLLKAFDWPSVRSRVTVDGVIAVVDGPAVAAGRFADDPAAVAAQRAADPALAHGPYAAGLARPPEAASLGRAPEAAASLARAPEAEENPLAEVYEDQLASADLVVLNKADLLDAPALDALLAQVARSLPRAVRVVAAREGRVDVAVLLGLGAQAEDDLAARPSHHDAEDGAHEHDDFESFVVALPEIDDVEALSRRLRAVAEAHDVLRAKGFVAVRGRPMRLAVQAVGARVRHAYDAPWPPGSRDGGLPGRLPGRLVVIGQAGLDRAAIAAGLGGEALGEPVAMGAAPGASSVRAPAAVPSAAVPSGSG